MDQRKLAETGAWISLAAYAGLAGIKLVVGHLEGSLSLRADGFNNVSDIVATVAVLAGLKIARQPRDSDHPYGHSRAETVAALLTSFLMMTIGLQVLFGAAGSLINPGPTSVPGPWALWSAAFSALLMLVMYLVNRNLAGKAKSSALNALSKDNLSDAMVSLGTIIAVLGARWNRPYLDPLVAIAIGAIICKTAWDIFLDASHVLTDGFDEEKLERYRKTVGNMPGVDAVHDIKARMYGSDVKVDVTIGVCPTLNVIDGHKIADTVEAELKRRHEVKTTHVHVEPLLKPNPSDPVPDEKPDVENSISEPAKK